jgi:hypothetical protein
MTTLLQYAQNGAICGHAFLKIEHPSPLTAPYPRLIVLDPANVAVQYDDADIAQVFSYRIRWDAEWRLEISWKARENIRLDPSGFEF